MKTILFAFAALALASPSYAAGLQLFIQDGRVSLDAQDVTVRQILNEWARVGRTRIVNADRVTGGPVTLKFEAVPEKQALDIVLRNVPGYVAAPRETLIANASVYDTIMIMPTTTAVAAVRTPAPAFGGSQGRPAGSLTQLQPAPAAAPEPAEPALDQIEDPAITAAAAAGLVTVPVPLPGGPGTGASLAAPAPAAPPASKPSTSNPWNAPVGTAQPSLAPPPAPAPPQPQQQPNRPRPPQGDR